MSRIKDIIQNIEFLFINCEYTTINEVKYISEQQIKEIIHKYKE